MSAGIFVSTSESAAYILKKSAIKSAALNSGKEHYVSGASKMMMHQNAIRVHSSLAFYN